MHDDIKDVHNTALREFTMKRRKLQNEKEGERPGGNDIHRKFGRSQKKRREGGRESNTHT